MFDNWVTLLPDILRKKCHCERSVAISYKECHYEERSNVAISYKECHYEERNDVVISAMCHYEERSDVAISFRKNTFVFMG